MNRAIEYNATLHFHLSEVWQVICHNWKEENDVSQHSLNFQLFLQPN